MNMDNIILPRRHYLLEITSDIRAICQPLFTLLGITDFYYLRYFDDNTCYVLTTCERFFQYRLEKDYQFNPLIPKHMLQKNIIYMPNENDERDQIIQDYCQLFQMKHLLYLIERQEGYFDAFHFSTKTDNRDLPNAYLNKLDILEKFKFYFREKARKLIETARQHKIFVPKSYAAVLSWVNSKDQIK